MGYDEAFQIPSEEAVTLSLRTQQIVALESGVPRTADPLAGSYFVEHLTDELEARANDVLDRDRRAGGRGRRHRARRPAAMDRRVRLPDRTRRRRRHTAARRGERARRPRRGSGGAPRGVRPRHRRRRATGRAHRGPGPRARRCRVLGRDRGRRRGGARGPQRHAGARWTPRAWARRSASCRTRSAACSASSGSRIRGSAARRTPRARPDAVRRRVAGDRAPRGPRRRRGQAGGPAGRRSLPGPGDRARSATSRCCSCRSTRASGASRSTSGRPRPPTRSTGCSRRRTSSWRTRGPGASRRTAWTGSRSTRGTRRSSTGRSPATATWVPRPRAADST